MEFQNRWQFGGLKTIVAPASTAKRLEWLLKMEKNVIKKICVTVPLSRIDWLAMITKLLFIIITW